MCRPKTAKIPFMLPPSEESDIKAPQGILKVQVCALLARVLLFRSPKRFQN